MFVLAFGLAPASPAFSQPESKPERDTPTIVDVWDALAWLRHKTPPASPQSTDRTARQPAFVFAPSIGYKPVTGFALGASGNVAATLGDPATTRASSVAGGAQVTFGGLLAVGADVKVFTGGDRWYVDSSNDFEFATQDTYAVGPHTAPRDAVNARFHFLRLYETVYRRVRPGLFVGIGVNVDRHTQVEPGTNVTVDWASSPYGRYTIEHGFDLAGQRSNGATLSVRFDDRDNTINPDRGWYGDASYRAYFKGFLGGDAQWQELELDFRTYPTLTRDRRHKLAVRVYADLVTEGVAPYFDLPATGLDSTWRSGRGYSEGRFRGEQLLYGEVEYRTTLMRNGLVGMVAFLNTTTVANRQSRERLFDEVSPAAGVGLRVLVSKRSRTNLCLDVAFGKGGSHGLYLAVGEAF